MTKKKVKKNKVDLLNERTARILGAVVLGASEADGKPRKEVTDALDFITAQKGASTDQCKFILDKIEMAVETNKSSAQFYLRAAAALQIFSEDLVDCLKVARNKKSWKHCRGNTWRIDLVPKDHAVQFTVNKKVTK